MTGVPKSEAHKENLSKVKLGVPLGPQSESHRENISTASKYKVISMLDGRITTHNNETRWNKKNPDYIGTWVRL
jgi:hypothetical protein